MWNLWDITEPRKNDTLPEENIVPKAPEDPGLDSLPEAVKGETGEGIPKGNSYKYAGWVYISYMNFDL